MDVTRHNGDSVGVDGTEVGIFEQTNKIRFGRFLLYIFTLVHYMSFLHYREVFCTDWLSFGKIKSLKILDNYILFVQTDNCHVPTQYGSSSVYVGII